MNAHTRIDIQSAAPVAKTKPSLAQLIEVHRKITELVGTALAASMVDSLIDVASELLHDIASARATTWEEFGRKAQLLVDETPEGATEGWLTAVREGLYWDLKQLNGEGAQAAE